MASVSVRFEISLLVVCVGSGPASPPPRPGWPSWRRTAPPARWQQGQWKARRTWTSDPGRTLSRILHLQHAVNQRLDLPRLDQRGQVEPENLAIRDLACRSGRISRTEPKRMTQDHA